MANQFQMKNQQDQLLKRDDGQPLGRDDAQAQYEQMDWPVVREKITT
jgi:hypothetical protein